MKSETKTQYLNYMATLYLVFLQILLGTLYCGKYLCIVLESIFGWLKDFFAGANEALHQEIDKSKTTKKTRGGTT